MSRIALTLFLCGAAIAHAAPATITQLPSGNGHGFVVFDGTQQRVTDWLERPYRYLRPGQDPKGEGVPRRDLVYDLYFGVRAGSQAAWLSETTQTELGYLDDSHVVRAVATVGGLEAESLYFLPFEAQRNVLVSVVRVRNTTSAPIDATVFFNPNVKLGAGRPDPGADGESITFAADHAIETGPGGGSVVHLPIGGFDRSDCAGSGYGRVKLGQDLADSPRSANGNDLTLLWQKNLGTIAAGATVSWGVALVYTDGDADAALADVVKYIDNRSADALVTAALAEHEAWRKPVPLGLSTDENHLWRQSETVLRMSQIREPFSEVPKQKGHGMILASLPPGIWHVAWVRDAQYAIQALLAAGHLDEARDAIEFFLNAEAGSYQEYVGRPYRISVTRYFGDGQEESDWNADGPNPEYDGFGSFLWSSRALWDASPTWLDGKTHADEPFRTVLDDLVAAPLLANVESNGLIAADASIWEVHWQKRKQYAYTSITAARGLCDLSAMLGESDPTRAKQLAKSATQIAGAIRSQLVDSKLLLASSKEELLAGTGYLDAIVVEAINLGLLDVADPAIAATLDGLAPLAAASGGYIRNDDGGDYDSQEWIMIDLRLQQALRLAGRTAQADKLLDHVTEVGRRSHYLLPELLNTKTSSGEIGSVAGAWPMVGFGAGAYMLALAHRAQSYDEARPCFATDPNPTPTPKPKSGCQSSPGPALLLLWLAPRLRRRRRPQAGPEIV